MALVLQPELALDQENAAVYTLPLDHPEATLENVGDLVMVSEAAMQFERKN